MQTHYCSQLDKFARKKKMLANSGLQVKKIGLRQSQKGPILKNKKAIFSSKS